jgi:type I restriction enzyme, S subunit
VAECSPLDGITTSPIGTKRTSNCRPVNLVGMRLYGAGPFHRELKPAMQITKKSHFVIRAGDVIYNKLFAWKGTFGVVPAQLDGMFVSDKFPTYGLDRSQVDENYLRWFFRHPDVWEQARLMSTRIRANQQ